MKILFLGHSLITRRQWSFMEALERQGAKVRFLPPKTWGKHTYNGPSKNAVPVDIKNPEHGLYGYHYEKNFLSEQIDDFDPDWVGGYIEPYSVAASVILSTLIQSKKKDIKTFFHAYENLSQNLIGLPPTLKQNLRNQPRRADLVICGNYRALQFMNYYKAVTVQIPHCGIETDLFVPTRHETLDMGVFVGRDVPEKNWKLIKEMQDMDRSFMIYRPTAFVEDEKFPSVYHQGKVLVHPSLKIDTWKEQLGYVIPEALSCGLAAVQSIQGDNIEYFTGVPGVYNGDPTDAKQYLELFYKALDDYPNMEGRKWVVDNFSNDIIAKRWLEAMQ